MSFLRDLAFLPPLCGAVNEDVSSVLQAVTLPLWCWQRRTAPCPQVSLACCNLKTWLWRLSGAAHLLQCSVESCLCYSSLYQFCLGCIMWWTMGKQRFSHFRQTVNTNIYMESIFVDGSTALSDLSVASHQNHQVLGARAQDLHGCFPA